MKFRFSIKSENDTDLPVADMPEHIGAAILTVTPAAGIDLTRFGEFNFWIDFDIYDGQVFANWAQEYVELGGETERISFERWISRINAAHFNAIDTDRIELAVEKFLEKNKRKIIDELKDYR